MDSHEDKQNKAINRNIMVGEDFRSQALNNYFKVLDLQECVCYLKAEPQVYKERYLKLLTASRRESERFLMALEDARLEKHQLYQVIKGKEDEIVEMEKRNEDSLFLVKVLQKKLGYEFTIAHAQTMTEVT